MTFPMAADHGRFHPGARLFGRSVDGTMRVLLEGGPAAAQRHAKPSIEPRHRPGPGRHGRSRREVALLMGRTVL